MVCYSHDVRQILLNNITDEKKAAEFYRTAAVTSRIPASPPCSTGSPGMRFSTPKFLPGSSRTANKKGPDCMGGAAWALLYMFGSACDQLAKSSREISSTQP